METMTTTSESADLRYGQPDEKPDGKGLWHCQ